nr:4Fe-4S binding protein [Treponemataceae bacterium]
MNFIYPIFTEQTECQDCYKCIRQCPVKAISVENGHAKIIPEMCIMCGTCVIKCPSHAKRIRNDLSMAKQILKMKSRVFVSLAPSFASEFPDFTSGQIVAALKKLGFTGVSETALGADFVSAQIAQDLEAACATADAGGTEGAGCDNSAGCNNSAGESFDAGCKKSALESTGRGQMLFLSSACPAVVEFIKLYRPEFARYITDRASPLLAHSRFLKKYYGNDIGIVFIGPCIAKKREADTWDSIDCSLTFNDLKRWFEEENIRASEMSAGEMSASEMSAFEMSAGATGQGATGATTAGTNMTTAGTNTTTALDFVPFRAAKGVLYPVDGGMIGACKKYTKNSNFNSITISGIAQIEDALINLKENELTEPLFMELLACPG